MSEGHLREPDASSAVKGKGGTIPKIYDIECDELRPVTQDDVDTYMALRRAYGRISHAAKNPVADLRAAISDAHTELLARLPAAGPSPRLTP